MSAVFLCGYAPCVSHQQSAPTASKRAKRESLSTEELFRPLETFAWPPVAILWSAAVDSSGKRVESAQTRDSVREKQWKEREREKQGHQKKWLRVTDQQHQTDLHGHALFAELIDWVTLRTLKTE
jgi:hypothetical protein